MTPEEWESLCDRCAWCCVHKLTDESGTVQYTNVACRHLDPHTCRCSHYERRHDVADCVHITAGNAATLQWLPQTCAYRRLGAGLPLPAWHPLVTGDPHSARQAGMTVVDRVLREDEIADIEEHVIRS